MAVAAMLATAPLASTADEAAAVTPDADACTPAGDKVKSAEIGAKVGAVDSLRDLKGNRRLLTDMVGKQGLVIAFMGTECPMANVYMPRLMELEKEFRDAGFQFLAVYPNEDESIDEIAANTSDHDVPFLVLKDFDQRLADALGVRRTPEVCVLDHDLTLRYRGRIDDQYSIATRRPAPKQNDLRAAIEALAAGREVENAEVAADGCPLKRRSKSAALADVTFAKHVAPILQERCENCHRPGRTAPFALQSYDDAHEWSESIREVVRERRMPPWHADARYGQFHNNRSLSDEEVETIVSWVDSGTPMGRPEDLPPAREWHEGWAIGEPDMVFEMPVEYEVPAEGVLPYRYIVVPTNLKEDRWVKAAEAMPGSPSVVHHIIVHMVLPGANDLLGGGNDDINVLVPWAPGDTPLVCPEDTALFVPAGTELVFEMHYTPNGKVTKDRSKVGVVFADAPPKRALKTNMFENGGIYVKAGAPHHAEQAVHTFHRDAKLLALLPHMHWRGKSFSYEAIYPDGRVEKLLSVPRWDFNWQTSYWFDEARPMPKGTRIRAVAHWDNSALNPANPDPTKNVRWGLQTWEEMMVGWMTYVYDEPVEVSHRPVEPNAQAKALFNLLDLDDDGVIAAREIATPLRNLMERHGVDSNAGVTPVVFEVLYVQLGREIFGR